MLLRPHQANRTGEREGEVSDQITTIAMRIAIKAHEGQFRRDGKTPYINHPADVVGRVSSDTSKAVAWLHDVLEDTTVKDTDLIDAGLPDSVIQPVILLTRGSESYELYLARIKDDPVAREVKIADMLSNLSSSPSDRQILKYARGLQILLS